mgnify:CR=1 FL=1
MSDVKAEFPIGKTQWAKWNDEQKTAFNEARAAGVPFADAIQAANQTEGKKHHGLLGVIENIADVATEVAGVVTSVAPVVAVAKTVVKATKGKKGK